MAKKSKKIVQVKKIKTVDKLDRIKKNRFIKTYEKTRGHISESCQVVGIARQTYYNWLDKNDWFANKIMEVELKLNDDIKRVLVDKAKDEKDMTAVIFYLKKRHPEFRDQPQQTNVQVNVLNNLEKEKNEFGI